MKMEQSVPKRRHMKFRSRGFTQKNEYNTAKVWSQEIVSTCDLDFLDPVLCVCT